MGSDPALPTLWKKGANRYLAVILFLGLLPASAGLAYVQAQTSEITVLHLSGAPPDIVFIADPHLKDGNRAGIRTIADEINTLRPSLVLIGGDFVYADGEDLALQEVWRVLDAPVFAVLGNHDYKSGITATSWVEKNRAVRAASFGKDTYDVRNLNDGSADTGYAERLTAVLHANEVTVLRNEYLLIDAGGQPLLLVGIDDGWAGMADPPVIPHTGAFTLYLIHEPECRADWDAGLILAGHTHGGQFLPRNMPLPGFELGGLVERNGVLTYITRGIGTSNLGIEMRLFATPEIVVINPSRAPEDLFPGKKVVHITAG